MRRPDTHPKIVKLFSCHSVPIIRHFNKIFVDLNCNICRVGVVSVFYEFCEGNVRFPNKAFAEFSKKSGINFEL